MSGYRSGGMGPTGWIIGGFVLVFFILPTLFRAGGGMFSIFIFVVIGWFAFQLIKAGTAGSRRRAPETWQPPDQDGERAERVLDVRPPAADPKPPAAPPAPPAPPPPTSAEPTDDEIRALESRLADLAAQRDRGELTDEAYEAARADAFRGL